MKKQSKLLTVMEMAVALLFYAIIFSFPQNANAGSTLVSIEGVSYNVNLSTSDNLKTLIGKKVYVHLDSGTTLKGVVKAVGNHLMHLEKIEKRDFFDALIRMDHIVAIDTQFRKYK